MQKSVRDARHFQDEEAAYSHLEAGLWRKGPVFRRCGQHNRIYQDGRQKPEIKATCQGERFKETTREIGADASSGAFDRIVGKMARLQPDPRDPKKLRERPGHILDAR